jgi:hypothetical protein
MVLHIGDRVIYEDGGEPLKGEIVDIWKNNQERITGYFVILDSGIYVQFLPDNLKWSELEEPVLIA